MKIKQTNLWVTRIWEIEDIFDEEFNNNFLKELLEWREDHGPWSGCSPDHFNSDRPFMTAAREKIMEILNQILEPLFGDEWPEIECNFQKGWLNDLQPGTAINIHPHDGSSLAIVYYIQADENSGDLILIDPRRGTDITDLGTRCCKYERYKPTVGKMIIVPGYLLHEVMQNNSSRSRYSFAAKVSLSNPTRNNW